MGYGMQAGGGATPYQTPYVQQGVTMPPMGYGMVTPPMGMGIQPAFIAPAPAPYGYAYQAAPPPYYY